jgi:hypothetical protein
MCVTVVPPGRARTCNFPISNRALFPVELRGPHKMRREVLTPHADLLISYCGLAVTHLSLLSHHQAVKFPPARQRRGFPFQREPDQKTIYALCDEPWAAFLG